MNSRSVLDIQRAYLRAGLENLPFSYQTHNCRVLYGMCTCRSSSKKNFEKINILCKKMSYLKGREHMTKIFLT